MQPESGRSPEPSGETLLPPAFTQWRTLAEPADGPDAPLAPFFTGVPGVRSGSPETASVDPGSTHPASVPAEDVLYEDAFLEEGQLEQAAPYDEALTAEAYDSVLLEDLPSDDALLEEATFVVAAQPGEEDLAAEEDTLVLLEEVPEGGVAEHRIAEEVADRLEVLAGRLRESGLAALDASSTDAVDTVLAAVLSGYVAARSR